MGVNRGMCECFGCECFATLTSDGTDKARNLLGVGLHVRSEASEGEGGLISLRHDESLGDDSVKVRLCSSGQEIVQLRKQPYIRVGRDGDLAARLALSLQHAARDVDSLHETNSNNTYIHHTGYDTEHHTGYDTRCVNRM